MKRFVLVVVTTLATLRLSIGETDTNSVGPVTFRNVNPAQIAWYFARLSRKPIMMQDPFPGTITFERRGGTHEGLLRELKAELAANGCFLVEIENRYYKLVPVTETNRIVDVEHVEIEITPKSIIVEDQVVPFEGVADAVKGQLKSDTEVWIHDPASEGFIKKSVNFWTVQNELLKAGIRRDKIFRALLP